MNDAISHIRVSSEEQPDSGLGLEAQRSRRYAFDEVSQQVFRQHFDALLGPSRFRHQ
jgi:hypothetical protein